MTYLVIASVMLVTLVASLLCIFGSDFTYQWVSDQFKKIAKKIYPRAEIGPDHHV